jgi:DNA-binding protein YbaB
LVVVVEGMVTVAVGGMVVVTVDGAGVVTAATIAESILQSSDRRVYPE